MKAMLTLSLMLFAATALQAQNYKPFKAENGKYGYKDVSGKIVVRPIYIKANAFSEGLAAVYMEKDGMGNWGFIDEKGKVVIPFKWADVGDFHEGIAIVIAGFYFDKKNQWGAINKEGKIIIPLMYENLQDFINGKAEAYLNGRTFYIDKTGKEIASNQPAAKNTENYNQLTGVWNVSVKDKKMGLPDQFKIDIKNIVNGKAEVWMLSNGKPYKQYKEFRILKNDKDGLTFIFQFSHDDKKIQKGSGTISVNLSRMEGTQLSPLTSSTIATENWIAVKETISEKQSLTPTTQPNTKNNTIAFSKLAGVWNVTIKDHQTGIIGKMQIELKTVNGNFEAWRVVNGKADLKYTIFTVFRNESNAITFNFELNVPPGLKLEGTGTWNNDLTQMTGVQLTSGFGPQSSAQWTAVKENTGNTPVNNNTNKTDVPTASYLLNEDFIDNRNKWPTGSNNDASTSISNGQYIYEMKQSYYHFNWMSGNVLSKINQQKDFTLETQFSVLSGYEEYPVWFLWGHKDMQNQFAFSITASGKYEYSKKAKDVITVIIPSKSSTAIKTGKNVANKLSVKKIGNKIEFYINDVLVDHAAYENFNPQTTVGFLLQNQKKIAVDYIKITQ